MIKNQTAIKNKSEIKLASTKAGIVVYLWNVDSGPEELQVLPHLLWFKFGVEDGQLGEHAHVSTLQPQRCLQHGDQLLKVGTVLQTAM